MEHQQCSRINNRFWRHSSSTLGSHHQQCEPHGMAMGVLHGILQNLSCGRKVVRGHDHEPSGQKHAPKDWVLRTAMKKNLSQRRDNLLPNGYAEFYTHMPVSHPMLFGKFPLRHFKSGAVFATRVAFYACACVLSVAANDELMVTLRSKIFRTEDTNG